MHPVRDGHNREPHVSMVVLKQSRLSLREKFSLKAFTVETPCRRSKGEPFLVPHPTTKCLMNELREWIRGLKLKLLGSLCAQTVVPRNGDNHVKEFVPHA